MLIQFDQDECGPASRGSAKSDNFYTDCFVQRYKLVPQCEIATNVAQFQENSGGSHGEYFLHHFRNFQVNIQVIQGLLTSLIFVDHLLPRFLVFVLSSSVIRQKVTNIKGKTSKTRFYKPPATTKIFGGLM